MTQTNGITVYFDIIDLETKTCKILGTLDMYASIFLDPPAPLLKGATVRLIKGKFPLTDHSDNTREIYTLELEEGHVRISGTLKGFAVDSTEGIPRFALTLS